MRVTLSNHHDGFVNMNLNAAASFASRMASEEQRQQAREVAATCFHQQYILRKFTNVSLKKGPFPKERLVFQAQFFEKKHLGFRGEDYFEIKKLKQLPNTSTSKNQAGHNDQHRSCIGSKSCEAPNWSDGMMTVLAWQGDDRSRSV